MAWQSVLTVIPHSDKRYLLFLRLVLRLRTTLPFLIVNRCSLAGPRLVTFTDGLRPVFALLSIRNRSPGPVLVMLLLCLPSGLVVLRVNRPFSSRLYFRLGLPTGA